MTVSSRPKCNADDRARSAYPKPRRTCTTDLQVARIEQALTRAAMLVESDDAYLEIFVRLETELEAAKERQSASARAKAMVKGMSQNAIF
ncbi:hypothetical protein OCH239_13410 [Roseivivax halodurans JCM 10272]|uniref:Uncharacterized protein n=1 Tax=Roseivivax halodurans JCM 10272 TaxID=1449350 RepID=X7EAJ9_9RHOB|nr:hypothetical protein [Roseivivax halodurans]ETX13114.1 hypothetical protein OCH239_13410 [Roseivivax halodurans JCM 10272]